MTAFFTMHSVKGHFVVTAPDIPRMQVARKVQKPELVQGALPRLARHGDR